MARQLAGPTSRVLRGIANERKSAINEVIATYAIALSYATGAEKTALVPGAINFDDPSKAETAWAPMPIPSARTR